jgi:hypothetical protein
MAETQSDLAQYQTDHDLLVTLNERVKNLIEHVTSVVSSNDRLAGDHEGRIRMLEGDRKPNAPARGLGATSLASRFQFFLP